MDVDAEFKAAGDPALALASQLLDQGLLPAAVASAFIAVSISVADAAYGKAEAIHLLHEMIADLKDEAN